MAETALPQGIQLTPFDPAFREDPYPILRELRLRAPIHRDDALVRHGLHRRNFFVGLLSVAAKTGRFVRLPIECDRFLGVTGSCVPVQIVC